MEAWFPQGPEDDSIVLIKVTGETAEYWDGPGGRVSSVLSLVKSKLTGERYSGGDNDKVDLGVGGLMVAVATERTPCRRRTQQDAGCSARTRSPGASTATSPWRSRASAPSCCRRSTRS